LSEVINKHSRMPRADNQIEPMKREKLTRGQLASLMGGLNPLAKADPKKVLLRYLADESTLDIAKSYGVTRSALNKWLRNVAEEEWLEAQCSRAIARKEKAEDALEAATNSTEIARAEKVLKGAQWELEKVNRRIYGQETMNINLNLNADLGDRLRRAREREITVSTPPSAPLAHTRATPIEHQAGDVASTPRQVIDMETTDHNP
jgi:hypothetical protein